MAASESLWKHPALIDLYGRPFNVRHYSDEATASDEVGAMLKSGTAVLSSVGLGSEAALVQQGLEQLGATAMLSHGLQAVQGTSVGALAQAGLVTGGDVAVAALLSSVPGAGTATSALGLVQSGLLWAKASIEIPPMSAAAFVTLRAALQLVIELIAAVPPPTDDLSAGGAAEADALVDTVAAALRGAIELGDELPINSGDPARCVSFLGALLPRITGLEPGGVLCIPAGWSCGEGTDAPSQAVLVVVMRSHEPDGSYDLFVCNAGAGVGYHPARPDVLTGGIQLQLPLRMRQIPAGRMADPTFWFLALRQLVWPAPAHGPRQLYEQLLPFLNCQPVSSNGREAGPWSDPPSGLTSLAGGCLAMQVSIASAPPAARCPPLTAYYRPGAAGCPTSCTLLSAACTAHCCPLQPTAAHC